MVSLFKRLFMRDPLDTSIYMWWDSQAYDYFMGHRARSNEGEESRIQDVMFEVLEEILKLPAEHCQTAALHGLGHLMHPDRIPIVSFPNISLETSQLTLS